MKNCN